MPRTPVDAPALNGSPSSRPSGTLKRSESFSLRVTAHFTDGSDRGRHGAGRIRFERGGPGRASTPMAGSRPGRSPARRRSRRGSWAYSRTAMSIFPCRARSPPRVLRCPRSNFIDGHVWTKLQQARDHAVGAGRRCHLSPARVSRRHRPLAHADEDCAFLADSSTGKRARLVDRLLERPEYADHWANKWVDLLRPESVPRRHQGGLQPRRLASRRVPPQQAVRPVRARDRHGPGQHLHARAGDDLPRPPRAGRNHADGQPAVPRHPARMCQVPPSPVRVWGQDEFYSSPPTSPASAARATACRHRSPAARRSSSRRKRDRSKHPLTGKVLTPRPLFGTARRVRRSGRRSARGAGRLDDRRREPVFRAG